MVVADDDNVDADVVDGEDVLEGGGNLWVKSSGREDGGDGLNAKDGVCEDGEAGREGEKEGGLADPVRGRMDAMISVAVCGMIAALIDSPSVGQR